MGEGFLTDSEEPEDQGENKLMGKEKESIFFFREPKRKSPMNSKLLLRQCAR